MIRRTSTFALFLTLTALLASSALAGNGQSQLRLVPQNSAIVININIEQVRSTPIYQMLWGMISTQGEVQEILGEMEARAGFNPNTDLNGMLVALSGDEEERYVIAVEGSYNVAQIQAYLGTLEASEITNEPLLGHTVWSDPSETGGNKPYFTFANANLMVIGTRDMLTGALEALGGAGSNVSANAALNSLVEATDKSGAFWFAGVLPPSMTAEMAGSPLAGMSTMRGHGNLAHGLNVNYTLGTGTAEEAAGMATFLNQGLAQARTQPEIAQMGLASLLDAVTISSAGSEVTVDVAIPETTLNQIMGMMTAIMAAEGL